ncbi:MAG: hypothetical protein Ct9H300mP28_21810 [Pseudomonadota bacterium]|nr:MAG: hypothetical protein Ct9H300mP28_21810 [Pseudomonadota bacterium]
MKGATLMSLEQNDEASEWMEKATRHPNAGFGLFPDLRLVKPLWEISSRPRSLLLKHLKLIPT